MRTQTSRPAQRHIEGCNWPGHNFCNCSHVKHLFCTPCSVQPCCEMSSNCRPAFYAQEPQRRPSCIEVFRIADLLMQQEIRRLQGAPRGDPPLRRGSIVSFIPSSPASSFRGAAPPSAGSGQLLRGLESGSSVGSAASPTAGSVRLPPGLGLSSTGSAAPAKAGSGALPPGLQLSSPKIAASQEAGSGGLVQGLDPGTPLNSAAM